MTGDVPSAESSELSSGAPHPKAQDPSPPCLVLRCTHLEIITHQQVQHQQVTKESAKIWDNTL